MQVLRLMKGYDEYNTILLPPRAHGEKLPPELLEYYDEQLRKMEEAEKAKREAEEAEELARREAEEGKFRPCPTWYCKMDLPYFDFGKVYYWSKGYQDKKYFVILAS